MRIERKKGKDLADDELAAINSGRRLNLDSKYDIKPLSGDDDFEADFFLLKDDLGKLLAFAKVEEIDVDWQGKSHTVLKFSMLVSLDKGKGYGKAVMAEIKRFVDSQEKTALGFCETELIPFYRKCGLEVLSNADNQFYYLEADGQPIANANIVPGEVIVIRGKDGFMDKVLSSGDKRVGIYKS